MNPELEKAVAELKRLGATPEEVQAYLAEHQQPAESTLDRGRRLVAGAPASVRTANTLQLDVQQKPESTMALPHNREDRSGDFEAAAPSLASLPLIAAQIIPGAETFQAAAGMVGSRIAGKPLSLGESRDALRSVTDAVPGPIKAAVQAPGMLATGKALTQIPKVGAALRSPAAAGAALGGADQALSADNMSLEERVMRTGLGVVGGAAAGKTLDMMVTGGRMAKAKRFDKNILDREDAMAAADEVAYGAAAKEGVAAGGTSDAIKEVLSHEKIAPFAASVRLREQFKGATDAEVLTEAYKLMSREQRRLGRAITNSDDYAANDVLRKEEIDLLKQKMLAAADGIMPSFRGAVRGHAQRAGQMEAAETGALAMSKAGMKVGPSQVERYSPEAFRRQFAKMTRAERKAAEQGVLGYLKEQPIVRPNLISAGGLLSSADRVHRAGGLLRNVNTAKQRWLDDILRGALVGSTDVAP